MKPLQVVALGTQHIVNPGEGEVPFLSAASGVAWVGNRLYSVGDDQATLAEYYLDSRDVLKALRVGATSGILGPGRAKRIIPGVLPQDEAARKEHKADFEALTVIKPSDLEALPEGPVREESLLRFPHGVLLVAGSGGVSWGGTRRSVGVTYSLDERGHIVGLPAKISLQGLHEHLQEQVVAGELNIEGICVHQGQLIFAQRGNSFDAEGRPASNMLIRLSLQQFLESLYTDLSISSYEVDESRAYDLGSAENEFDGRTCQVKLDFTDLDSVTDDPEDRLVFTAAAEGTDGPAKGKIAGSVVGVIDRAGEIVQIVPLEDKSIKLEGVDATYNHTIDAIDLLLVSDADDPEIPAPLMAARIEG